MKKKIIIFLIGLVLLVLGVSFAYYTIQIVGTGSNMVMETAYLRLVLTDNASIVEDSIIPGWSTSKTFTIENKANANTTYDLLIENFQNTFVTNGFLQFKIESEDGYNTISDDNNYINVPKSQIAKKLVLAYNISLDKDAKHEYTISFRYKDSEENQAADMQKILSGNIGIQNGTESTDLVITDLDSSTLKYHILSDNGVYNTEWAEERTNFNTAYSDSARTFFRTNNAELGETVLYYAGDARNNWVIFGKCPQTGGKNCTPGRDLYWRIIRTNEASTGGGIRLLYSGSGLVTDSQGNKIIGITQNGYIGTSNWYSLDDKPNYVGYTIGTDDYTEGTTTLSNIRGNNADSNIKIAVDNFYKTTFENTDYENYIDTKAVYCNDRSTTDDKSGGLTKITIFGAYGRLESSKAPSLACGANTMGFKERAEWAYYEGNTYEDRYSKDVYNVNGVQFTNGWLDYPIALMTGDEVIYAGGNVLNNNLRAWYGLNASTSEITSERSIVGSKEWWTMSPTFSRGYTGVFNVLSTSGYFGRLNSAGPSVKNSYLIRPVLSLTANTKWLSGNGTIDSPYQINVE